VLIGETGSNFAVQDNEETEEAEFADWRALSLLSMWEYWGSEEDAVYDDL
jgi:hypothetical protein